MTDLTDHLNLAPPALTLKNMNVEDRKKIIYGQAFTSW